MTQKPIEGSISNRRIGGKQMDPPNPEHVDAIWRHLFPHLQQGDLRWRFHEKNNLNQFKVDELKDIITLINSVLGCVSSLFTPAGP